MTTNNHPANGPVSLERLHQISEILSKAAAQSDGGNLGYAMADAVKVIDGAIAKFGAEPVAWKSVFRLAGQPGSDFEKIFENREAMDAIVSLHERGGFNVTVTPLYTAPPAPVVPDEMYWQDAPVEGSTRAAAYATGWNACRAAMLQAGNHTEQHLDMVDHSGYANEKVDCRLTFDQWLSQQNEPIDVDCGCVTTEAFYHWLRVAYEAGNSPVTPDCWIPVSERMPDDDDFVYIWPRPDFGIELHVGQYCECHPKGDGWYAQVYEQNYGIEWHPIIVTHWMPLPAAPRQEVK
ncbi:DUF551 domain-containing protein [Citrobacter freundii]|uniref:DUF551 domain-containing protein n=1 Tax=Citrobacter freundii TaxID=546 RepID=UPI00388F7143